MSTNNDNDEKIHIDNPVALLIAVMLVPTDAALVFTASSTVDDISTSAYLKDILQQKDLPDMTESQKVEFIQKVKEYFSSSPYHNQIFILIEKISEVKFQIAEAKTNGESTTKLIQQGWTIVYDLENYGVVSEERLTSNPNYWADRAKDAMERANRGDTVSVNTATRDSDNGIKQVHMDGVVLKNESEVRVPCIQYLFVTIYCPNFGTAYGLDTQTSATYIATWPGTFYMTSKVCIDEDGGHDAIISTYNHHHKVSNVFGTVMMLEEDTDTVTISEDDCDETMHSYSGLQATSGSMAHSYTYVHQTVDFVN